MDDSYKNKLYVLQETNYYKILGVNESAPIEAISKEYRHLAKLLHPDKHVNMPSAEKNELNLVFKKVTHAYEIIKDPAERKKFDLELKLKRSKEEAQAEQKKIQVKEENSAKKSAPPIPKTEPVPKPKAKEKVKENDSYNFQKNSPIKNDPRLKDSQSGFSFNGLNISMEPDQDSSVKTGKERELEQNQITFKEAKMYIHEHNYDEAINLLRKLTEKNGKVAVFHSVLGLAMQAKGWTGYAQAEFKVALYYDPNDPIALKHYNPTETSGEKPKEHEKQIEIKGVFGKIKSLFTKD